MAFDPRDGLDVLMRTLMVGAIGAVILMVIVIGLAVLLAPGH